MPLPQKISTIHHFQIGHVNYHGSFVFKTFLIVQLPAFRLHFSKYLLVLVHRKLDCIAKILLKMLAMQQKY